MTSDDRLIFRAVVYGPPVAKGRPRAAVIAGHARIYTPQRTRTWEADAAEAFRLAAGESFAPVDVPLALLVLAVAERPRRLMRKRDTWARVWRPHKPDADNVLKCCADALIRAGIIRDDAQLVDVCCRSLYASKDEGPRVIVELYGAGEVTL